MSQALLQYLKINCHQRIDTAYQQHKIDADVYYFAKAWLGQITNLLEPIALENTKESQVFFKQFLQDDQNPLRGRSGFIMQLNLSIENLVEKHASKPLAFFMQKYEKKANRIFWAGLFIDILILALCFYLKTFITFPLPSILVISLAVLVIFCIAAIHELQKSKSLENTFEEIVDFQNQATFRGQNKFHLFTDLENTCNHLDLPPFTL